MSSTAHEECPSEQEACIGVHVKSCSKVCFLRSTAQCGWVVAWKFSACDGPLGCLASVLGSDPLAGPGCQYKSCNDEARVLQNDETAAASGS